MFHSIRWRLVVSYLLLTLFTTMVLGLVMLSILKHYFVQQERAQLLQNAQSLASRINELGGRSDLDKLFPLISAYGVLSQAQIRIWDRSHHLLLDSQDPPADLQTSFSITGSRHDGVMEIGVRGDTASSEGALFSTMMTDAGSPWGGYIIVEATRTLAIPTPLRPLVATPTPLPLRVQVAVENPASVIGYVEMARGDIRGQQLLGAIRQALLWAGLAALFLALGMGVVISQTLTAPLASLAKTTQAMAAGNLRARAPANRRDEIGQLARQFNQMATNLEQTFAALAADRDALRRLIIDVSHELRTPITALRTFNELMVGPARDDVEARQEFLQESQEQIDRLDWLTQNLLHLSRLDSGLLKMNREPCRLGDVVSGVVSTFRPQAEAKGLVLATETPTEAVWALCDRSWTEQALGNLLGNAIKFTPPGGRVTVGVRELSSSVELWVEDTGIGIPAEDMPHIFERFYRGRNVDASGSGLGLAIVRSIVEAHHGHITVTSEVGRGSRFSMHLPKPAGEEEPSSGGDATGQGV